MDLFTNPDPYNCSFPFEIALGRISFFARCLRLKNWLIQLLQTKLQRGRNVLQLLGHLPKEPAHPLKRMRDQRPRTMFRRLQRNHDPQEPGKVILKCVVFHYGKYCTKRATFIAGVFSRELRLYKRVCPSVGPSVGPLVSPSVTLLSRRAETSRRTTYFMYTNLFLNAITLESPGCDSLGKWTS